MLQIYGLHVRLRKYYLLAEACAIGIGNKKAENPKIPRLVRFAC
jgi:hypothetical protein